MRLIDADELIKLIPPEEMASKYAVANAPTVEVVRCKDCKWWKTNYTWNGSERKVCVIEAYEPVRNENDYCSRGGKGKKMTEYKPFSLKPCPFCGSEVALTTTPLWHDGHGYQGCFEYSVFCKNCGCRVSGSTCDSVYFSEQEAIEKVVKAWNRRKENE